MSAALLSALAADIFNGSDRTSPAQRAVQEQRAADARAMEQTLVARVRAGDEAAFRALMQEYFPRIARFAMGIVGARDVADDIAQDVLASVWAQHTTWAPAHSIKAYLFGSARNRALNELKRRRVRASAAPVITEALEYHAASAPSAVDDVVIGEMIVALRRLVAHLPERRRTAIRLRYEEGLTYPAIAEILSVSVKSAEQLVALTVQSLRKGLRRFR